MSRTLLRIALRNFQREKGYTAINIFGLTLGLSCSLFLLLYIIDELSYDKHHVNAENIYRVVTNVTEPEDEYTWARVQVPLAEALSSNYTDVKRAVRFFSSGRELFQSDENRYYEEQFYFADSSIFEIFTHEFISGDPATALLDPLTTVLTESMAIKYFGSTDIIGATLLYVDRKEHYKVTGVIKDLPANTHFHFDGLLSLSSLPMFRQSTNWGRIAVQTYIQVKDGFDPKTFQGSLDEIVKAHVTPIFENRGVQVSYGLQRITDIHLHSKIQDEEEAAGDISFVYVLVVVSFLVIIIASINYMNLATARAAKRAKEVAVKKALGSLRSQLVLQFIAEALLLTFTSLAISILLVHLLMPVFNYLANKQLVIADLFKPQLVLIWASAILLIGVLGGSYPAFYLSKFDPAAVLKGNLTSKGGSALLRKSLVVVQFSISIFMVIATVIIYDQLDFLLKKDLGFSKDQVVRIAIDDGGMRKLLPLFKDALSTVPDVLHFSTAMSTPGENVRKNILQVEDNEGNVNERPTDWFMADYDFVDAMEMRIVKGRNFSRDILSDTMHAALVNEAMVRRMNWTEPLGKKFQTETSTRYVVGVVKDYHQNSLYNEIEPLVIIFGKNNYYTHIKVKASDLKGVVAKIENAWKSVYPGKPFEFQFLDQAFDAQYDAEERRGLIFTIFSIVTIAIACLGLLGLTAFTTEQRAREIGIRKVVGASSPSLVLLISREFVVLVIISACIALPAVCFFIERWLREFPYRIALTDETLTCVVAVVAVVMLTMLTVVYHSAKAANANPVKSLRVD
ncbi:MAG TPA: FtsX-like permease family protein [Chryseosolibacter sp.]